MHRIAFAIMLGLWILSAAPAIAQKYMTRTGQIYFYGSTPLESIEAYNHAVAAALDLGSGELVFQVPIRSFIFEKALMQEHFNENYMESDRYPRAEFKGKLVDSPKEYAKSGTYSVEAEGIMTIHGVSRKLRIPGTLKREDDLVQVLAEFEVVPGDYEIAIPKLVENKIARVIDVKVNATLEKHQKGK